MKITKPAISLIMIIGLAMLFSGPVLAGDIQNSKLLPAERVTVFEDGKKIASYTKEMPVPEGLELRTEGKSAIKLDDISLVAEDQSRFSIDYRNNARVIDVKQGTVYFGASDATGTLVFLTPKGGAMSDQILLNASSDSRMLEGYVKVTEESSEVGVLQGGSMKLVTRDDQRMIKPGQSLMLAQADIGTNPAAAQGTSSRRGLAAWWSSLSGAGKIGSVVAGGTMVGITAAGINAAADDDDDASPSTP
ncbi:MAG: hypothetical protein KFF46_10380 [Desulfobacterales bacterium]|nr:hypothetical protein [Desulfobacterales bacterium]